MDEKSTDVQTEETALDDWVEQGMASLSVLGDDIVPGVDFDSSIDSFRQVQRYLRSQVDLESEEDEPQYSGIAYYIGRTLLRLTGGRWGWDDASGRAVVVPNERLGISPACPEDMMFEASQPETDPEMLAGLWATWAAAADRYRNEDRS